MRLKRDFSLHWKNYLILFLVVELSLEVAVIPSLMRGLRYY